MIDPLSDPRARDLLDAAPEEVSALAGDLPSAAQQSRMTAAGLSAAQHDATWTGRAAGAFRRAIGLLPGELGRVHEGFRAVAVALDGYESELAPIRARFIDADYRLSEPRGALGPARATQEAAHRACNALPRSGTDSGAARLEAEQAVAGADAAVRGLESEVDRLAGRARRLLDEFQSVRDGRHTAIAAAQTGTIIRSADGHTPAIYGTGAPAGRSGRFL